MAATGRLEHSNLSSGLGSLRWTALGENVGYSSPDQRHPQDDPQHVRRAPSGHRANLLKSSYTHMGVGVAKDSRGGSGSPRCSPGSDRRRLTLGARRACQTPAMAGRRPNILFIVSDQERERSWLPAVGAAAVA